MRLPVFVTCRASKNELGTWIKHDQEKRELCVRVSAVPEKGKATLAAANLLADTFQLRKSQVSCVSGSRSRHKIYELPITEDDLRKAGL